MNPHFLAMIFRNFLRGLMRGSIVPIRLYGININNQGLLIPVSEELSWRKTGMNNLELE